MGQRISSSEWPSRATCALETPLRRRHRTPDRALAVAAYKIDNMAVPDTPPVVAVITAVPIASAVASPFGSTLAMRGCEEAHVKVCPCTRFPLASCATALNCCVSPRASSVALAGVTTTDLTICATDRVAVPDTPPVVAVIVVTPFASAVASPVTGSIVATPAGEADHVKLRPRITLPLASCAIALYCCCSRLAVASAADAGLTTTDRTICATARVAVPETPAAAAVIVAVPFATAVTTPLGSTRVTIGLSDVHVNACPEMTLPFASRAVAEKRCVSPSASSAAEAGVTTTCATAPANTASVGRGDVTGLPSIVAPIVRAVPASTPVNGAVYVPSP